MSEKVWLGTRSRTGTLLLSLIIGLCVSIAAQSEPEAIIRNDSIYHPVIGHNGMVSTQHALATEVGAKVLSAGGNAIDAAVAVGFSLAVVLPRAGNLGGGGFMLVHLADAEKTIALDYREVAPGAAGKDLFLDAQGNVDRQRALFSYQSAGVPGTVAGLVHAQEKYGSLPLSLVMKPAYDLARDGFEVTHDLSAALQRAGHLKKDPEASKVFYKANGEPLAAGDILRQPDLAASLRRIMREGSDAFYRGRIAGKIVSAMSRNGGLITADDLASYRPVERQPVTGDYRGYEVVSMPPPSSGGVHLVQMLNVLENFPLRDYGYGSRAAIHTMVETMKWAYADRSLYLGDPDFVDVPVQQLTAVDYAADIAARIDPRQSTPSTDIRPGHLLDDESLDTTHYSIVDADGNAVSNTYTLNFSFGSGIMVPGTGILLNNEMDDFSAKPGVANAYGLLGGEANAIAPRKRPLSSMTPTILLKDGRPYLVTGSPGGSRIITTVLQAVVNVVDHQMNVAEAVNMPRFHHQWYPDTLYMEKGFSPDTVEMLRQAGHNVAQTRSMGSAQSILIDSNGVVTGAADPRKPDARALPTAH